jgi:hypothetical protein
MRTSEQAAADGLAFAAVRELSPGEASLFDAASAAFWANGGRLPRAGAPGIGSDPGGLVIAIAPVALALASFGLKLLGDMVRDMAIHGARLAIADVYKRVLDRLSRGDAAKIEETVPLAVPEFQRLEALLVEEARKHLSAVRADELAGSVLRRLAHAEGEAA